MSKKRTTKLTKAKTAGIKHTYFLLMHLQVSTIKKQSIREINEAGIKTKQATITPPTEFTAIKITE